jgi:hypothetical protein
MISFKFPLLFGKLELPRGAQFAQRRNLTPAP